MSLFDHFICFVQQLQEELELPEQKILWLDQRPLCPSVSHRETGHANSTWATVLLGLPLLERPKQWILSPNPIPIWKKHWLTLITRDSEGAFWAGVETITFEQHESRFTPCALTWYIMTRTMTLSAGSLNLCTRYKIYSLSVVQARMKYLCLNIHRLQDQLNPKPFVFHLQSRYLFIWCKLCSINWFHQADYVLIFKVLLCASSSIGARFSWGADLELPALACGGLHWACGSGSGTWLYLSLCPDALNFLKVFRSGLSNCSAHDFAQSKLWNVPMKLIAPLDISKKVFGCMRTINGRAVLATVARFVGNVFFPAYVGWVETSLRCVVTPVKALGGAKKNTVEQNCNNLGPLRRHSRFLSPLSNWALSNTCVEKGGGNQTNIHLERFSAPRVSFPSVRRCNRNAVRHHRPRFLFLSRFEVFVWVELVTGVVTQWIFSGILEQFPCTTSRPLHSVQAYDSISSALQLSL